MKKWLPYDGGTSIGTVGSENGTILCDEEYDDICRITMEKCPRYYAITCGVYGSMVHTAFRYDDDAVKNTYEAMKQDLADFLRRSADEEETVEFYNRFCFEKYR